MGRYTIETSNEDRILFPKKKYTKKDLIDYYQKIGNRMIPYTNDRPLTMVRYPSGIDDEGFYQKDMPDYFPDWIASKRVPKKEGGSTTYVVCNNTATLMYLANQGCITPHVWLSKIDKLHYPDHMIFDLDPPSLKEFDKVQKAALTLKKLLESFDLTPYVKTTGSKGLHIVVPLRRTAKFKTVRTCAHHIAQLLQQEHKKELTLEIRKAKRGNNVFIDTLRNAFGATAVAPYGVRPKDGAPVATPIDWNEVRDKTLTSQRYTIKNIFKRLSRIQDPWHGMQRHATSIKERVSAIEKAVKQ